MMENLAEKLQTSGLPPRIERMKEAFLGVKPSVSIARAKATTEIYKSNPNLPIKILRAQAFYRACQTIPVHIGDDELIVGSPSGKQRAGVFCPEISWRWLETELRRKLNPSRPYIWAAIGRIVRFPTGSRG
jgi:hypothetical protein